MMVLFGHVFHNTVIYSNYCGDAAVRAYIFVFYMLLYMQGRIGIHFV